MAEGWFLSLCGPLTLTDAAAETAAPGPHRATAELRLPEDPAAHTPAARDLIAVEALHQIACRLSATARGAARCVPAKLAELTVPDVTEAADTGWSLTGARLEAELVRSGRLSTVHTRLTTHGRVRYAATVCAQEVS
ncbi:hypothetical protein ACN20G_13425 [Streptomyces sp. BI20]|uniref:hypothetical protein n=1 Tax=Streptomyces sp. BI20 TaxID=3403460 RepID=UPI003C76BA75